MRVQPHCTLLSVYSNLQPSLVHCSSTVIKPPPRKSLCKSTHQAYHTPDTRLRHRRNVLIPLMNNFTEIRMKVETCTPPASSPECSPMQRGYERPTYSEAPHGLGLTGYSYQDSPALIYPLSPPNNDAFNTQGGLLPHSTILPLVSQQAAWSSSPYEEGHLISASPMSWEPTSQAFNAPRVTYSPYSTHDLQPQQPAPCSSYVHEGYGVDTSISNTHSPNQELFSASRTASSIPPQHQAAQVTYQQYPHLHATSYADVYPSSYSNLSSPHSDYHASLASPLLDSDHTEQACSRSSRSSSAPGEFDSLDNVIALKRIARVRRPRRQTLGPTGCLAYACPVCGRQFDRTYNFKQHMTTHSTKRERPFACDYPGCIQRAFARVNDLDRHRENVSGRSS